MTNRNSHDYKTAHHCARAGMAWEMLKHSLSGRAMRYLVGMMAEMEPDGRWRRPPESPDTFTGQSKSVRLAARKELMEVGLLYRDPHDPLAWHLHPHLWFSGSERQLARHLAEYKRLARKPQRAPRFQHEPRAS